MMDFNYHEMIIITNAKSVGNGERDTISIKWNDGDKKRFAKSFRDISLFEYLVTRTIINPGDDFHNDLLRSLIKPRILL